MPIIVASVSSWKSAGMDVPRLSISAPPKRTSFTNAKNMDSKRGDDETLNTVWRILEPWDTKDSHVCGLISMGVEQNKATILIVENAYELMGLSSSIIQETVDVFNCCSACLGADDC